VIAMLGPGVDWGAGRLEGPHANRLVRISIPDGEIQGRRTLGQRLPAGDVDKGELVHLSAASGPLLAPRRTAARRSRSSGSRPRGATA